MECVSYEEDTDPRYKLKLPEVEDPRRVSFVAAGAEHRQERAGVRQRQYENAVYEMYEIYENAVYKNATRCMRTLQGVRGGPTTMRSMRWKVFTSSRGNRDSTVFAKESKAYHLPQICLPGAESTWELAFAVRPLRKLISTFIPTRQQPPPIDTVPPVALSA